MDKTLYLKQLIDNANNIVFFGGAGVSTASNIPDFRSETGLYNLKSKYGAPYEVMLSHTYFFENTLNFYKFYKEFMIYKDAKPNIIHNFLTKLQNKKNVTIITQNIDGLHSDAKNKNVLELHGSIHRNYCLSCHAFYNLEDMLKIDSIIPICPKCGGIIKPDVVLYEEGLDYYVIEQAIKAISQADLIIVCGTSLKVYPANSFLNYANTKDIIVINKEYLDLNDNCLLQINDDATKIFNELDKII